MSDKPIDADCAGKLTILPGERVDELQQAGLRILQKEQGFRFGMDAVLLSSFVRAESRDRCADFGTGIMARHCRIRRKRCPWRAISRKAG